MAAFRWNGWQESAVYAIGGKIDIGKEFDDVLLVVMDESFNATAIYEATREAVVGALKTPGSKARNERGQLSMSKFKSIGRQIWPKEP